MNVIDNGIIKNENISLRLITPDDTDKIIAWRNNPEVCKNFIYQKPLTENTHLYWIESMINTGKAVQFIINNDELGDIGSTYLRDINHEHHKAEYGIFIGNDIAVGKGYGTIACKMVCQYGFEVLHLHKIFLRVFENNNQAIRSYEKSGFIREGIFHDDVCIEGKYHNILFMSLINPEEN